MRSKTARAQRKHQKLKQSEVLGDAWFSNKESRNRVIGGDCGSAIPRTSPRLSSYSNKEIKSWADHTHIDISQCSRERERERSELHKVNS